MIDVKIAGGDGRATAGVTKSGELVVSPLHYDETVYNELAVDDTAYNFYAPKSGKQFVITGMLAYADKQVSDITNAAVVVYEAASSGTTAVSKVLIQFELGQSQSIPWPNTRILVNPGVYVNAKTTDDDVHMTLLGYYIEEL